MRNRQVKYPRRDKGDEKIPKQQARDESVTANRLNPRAAFWGPEVYPPTLLLENLTKLLFTTKVATLSVREKV